MRRYWLRPFAAGAALVAVSAVGGWVYASYRQGQTSVIIQYIKPIGLHQNEQPPDPASKFDAASTYVVALAKNCGVRTWTLETNGIAHDADDIARLEIKWSDLSDRSFNCLASFVKPPLVTVERKSN